MPGAVTSVTHSSYGQQPYFQEFVSERTVSSTLQGGFPSQMPPRQQQQATVSNQRPSVAGAGPANAARSHYSAGLQHHHQQQQVGGQHQSSHHDNQSIMVDVVLPEEYK